MEPPRGPRKPLSGRRARSLDRLQNPQKDSESCDHRCISRPTSPSRRMPRRAASDGARCPKSPAQSVEAQGTTTAAPSPEETREFLPSEQRPPQDTKKDKAQCRAQQGWLRTMMNFLFGMGPEEPKEKTNKRAKGKEGLPEPAETPETPGEPAPRKKAHGKKASRKKHGHKKHGAEETKGTRDQEAKGQEIKMAGASCCKEADLGPAPGGEQTMPVSMVTPQPPSPTPRARDTIIQKIVEFLQKVGDQWEEEVRIKLPAQMPGGLLPSPPPPCSRKKSQERKSSLKKAFSHKKHSSEEPKRARAADVSSPESRPAQEAQLSAPVCWCSPTISSCFSGVEEPEVQEVLSTDGGDPSPFELSNPAGSRGPEEDLHLDRASEFRTLTQFLSSPPQQLQVQEPEVAVGNLAPTCRKKSQEKKSSFRKAFSHKKHGFKEPKRGGAAGAASPDARPPKRPSFLPLCVGGHRPSISNPEDLEFQESSPAEGGPVGSSEVPSQARSHNPEAGPQPDGANESRGSLLATLMACLHFCFQIRQNPSFKKFFYKLSDSSLRKLVATLSTQEANSTEPKRTSPFVFGLANKCAGSNYQAVHSLTGLHYSRNEHNIVKQLYSNKDVKKKKKKKSLSPAITQPFFFFFLA
uniref:BCL2 interacting protein 5 n=1 Tax=Balaenoptera musculus TaxID=9771 RepID=A0A8C0HZT2_BALMU